MKPAWFPDWSGETCAIVAGGPSVKVEEVSALRWQCRVIVVNNTYQLAPWADALYGADERWWGHYRPDFAGLKVSCQKNSKSPAEVKRLRLELDRHEILRNDDGVCGDGGFSGFQAINFAIHCGAVRILLLGFDFYAGHWHGEHPHPLIRETRLRTRETWRDRLDAQSARLEEMRICLLNCSPESLLRNYPKLPLRDALKSNEISTPPKCSCTRPVMPMREGMTERV